VENRIEVATSRPSPAEDPASARRALVGRANVDGPAALETAELLAVCLGGVAEQRVGSACELLERFEIAELARANVEELRRAADLPVESAARVAAAFELGRRVEAASRRARPSLRSPARVHELMRGELRGLSRETFHALLLDSKHRFRRRERVSEGTLTSSLVHPREVFGPALREGAAALIVVHNHPSGDPEPSIEDLAVTRRLVEAGRLLGVPLLDHVVIADGGYVSIRERISFETA
jgi:DNA repair protein RadC